MEYTAYIGMSNRAQGGLPSESAFIQAIKGGVSALSIKDELVSLEARKVDLQSRLEAPEMWELL